MSRRKVRHTLCGSADSTKGDRVPEHPRTVPFVIPFVFKSRSFLWSEHIDGVEVLAFSGNKGSPAKKIAIFSKIVTVGENLSILDHLFRCVALKKC